MFERRLKWFAALMTLVAVTLILRLIDIQVLHADEYENLAIRLLTRPVRYLRPPRGSICDRHGRVLLADDPSFDIAVHYAVLTGRSQRYLRAVARGLRNRGEYPAQMSTDEITAKMHHDISDMWRRLSELTGQPVNEFIERGERVRKRVERIRESRRRRLGVAGPLEEERQMHPVLEDVDDEVALAVRLELGHHPWLRVAPGSRRVAHDADSVVHLLGRLGAVSPQHLEDDPLQRDKLRELLPTGRCGVSGIERLAELTLRGTRGRVVEDLDRRQVERTGALAGSDVILTIDLDLQQYVLKLLEQAVENCVSPAGGSAVVIEVQTREVLALVSYPVYSYERFNEDYDRLRRNARRDPLRFRAVSNQYPPGSTCKAITLVGALTDGVAGEHERIHCTGHLLLDTPNKFRCWIYNRFRTTHDAAQPEGQNAEDAIRNSCNIYFYKVGGRLGPQRLCEWFSKFGLGRLQGTGLIEESPAIVPSERRLRRPHRPADAWNFAIGQGEVTATPLQVANVAATIAAGYWAPVRLIRSPDDGLHHPDSARQQFDPDALRVLRAGMRRVVNERGGTGYRAHLDRDDYVLCGKTGSAQAQPRPIAYRWTFEWPDGSRSRAIAHLEEDALALFGEQRPKRVGKHAAQFYPALLPGEPLPTHAWFMGYTQPAETPPGGTPGGQVYAVVVIIEYGGSGGRVAGPVAKQIAERLLQRAD